MGWVRRATIWVGTLGVVAISTHAFADTAVHYPPSGSAADTVPAPAGAASPARADTVPDTGDLPRGEPQPLSPAAPSPGDTLPAGTIPPDTAVADREAQAEERRSRNEEIARSDSIFQALLTRQGYSVMEYAGDSATFHASDRVLRLFGPAEVKRGQDVLTAQDTIIYREASGMVHAFGRPRMTGEGQPIEGNVMHYDLATNRATVLQGRTKIAERGTEWFVNGDVTAEGTERVFATRSIFTTDDRDEPAYYFQADQIKVIRDRVLVGRPARLYFRNVPVFWLPFIFQDLSGGRRSGLLKPEFGINDIVRTSSSGVTTRGTGRQLSNVGFYWAVNDFMDAQLSGGWRSGSYRSATGALRYRNISQFLQGDLRYSQYWREEGNRELRFSGNSSWRPDERTNLSFNGNYASSSQFHREISMDPTLATQTLGSSASLNRRFDWGALDLNARRDQSLADGRETTVFPSGSFNILPITFFSQSDPNQQTWYSNSTFALRMQGSRERLVPGEVLRPGDREQTRARLAFSPEMAVGDFNIPFSFSANQVILHERPGHGELDHLAELNEVTASWNTGFNYNFRLIGETSFAPGISISQDLRRDTTTAGAFQSDALRTNFNASLGTSLYGFLPGVGPFTTIRHKITPSFTYTYSPAVEGRPRPGGAPSGTSRVTNVLNLGTINQTFEGKLRRRAQPDPGESPADTAALADAGGMGTTGVGGAAGADPVQPEQEEKVTILALTTSGMRYDFAPAADRPGFQTTTINNSITSAYLRGLQLDISHDLFATPEGAVPGGAERRFSPKLTSLSTRFSLGEDNPLLRWLGFGQSAENLDRPATAQADSIPSTGMPTDQFAQDGSIATFGGRQPVGRGPWSLDVGYMFSAARQLPGSTQLLSLSTRFTPTDNWAVSWVTSYSITDGQFGSHRLSLTRDLYRWQANFNFSRTPMGNTSFDVLVSLKDLPDVKVPYREHNLGARR
jgi:hypothetical protein